MEDKRQPLSSKDKAAIYFALDKAGDRDLAEKFRRSVGSSDEVFQAAIRVYRVTVSAMSR